MRQQYRYAILLLCLVLWSCSNQQAQRDVAETAVNPGREIAKSPNDDRQYRALYLENGLQVLLVSDASSDKAAASMNIGVGSGSDPDQFAGLTHFLEHMLFLGTEKFPEAGEYQTFISSHGGSHNAYTAYENTNYYFDIETASLDEALDRFSQFFISPLFTEEYVDRERNAVYSEYQTSLQNDARRANAIYKQVINQNHPMSRFTVGNLETLQRQGEISLRNALIMHYEKYYSADNMKLAVLGNQTLDELESTVKQYFSAVPYRNLTLPQTTEPLFIPGTLPALLQIQPVRDTRGLTFTFPIPVMQQYYKSKPLSYLGNILGHEGEGSLFSILKGKGWVNGLSAGAGANYSDHATFSVSVSLTEAGEGHVNAISALLFQSIALIRRQGVQEWLFDEQASLAQLNFLFQEPPPAVSYVTRASSLMQQYPVSEVNTTAYSYEIFNQAVIEALLAYLVPDNVLLTYTSRNAETDQQEQWFGGQFSIQSISPATQAFWMEMSPDSSLKIPAPNPFIPEDLALVEIDGNTEVNKLEKPQLLIDRDATRLWFRQDPVFRLPRASFYLYVQSPYFNDSLENKLISEFAIRLLGDQLNEFGYPARLAGVSYGVSPRARGFTVQLGGYNDKQQELLASVLEALKEADFEQERFTIIKTEYIRAMQNAGIQTPYTRLLRQNQALLTSPYWSEQERINAVESITLEQIKAGIPRLMNNIRLEAFYYGNISEHDAYAMLDVAQKYLSTADTAPIPSYGKVLKLPSNLRVMQDLEVEHEDSAIVIYMQGPDDSLRTRASLSLLATILRPNFYQALRTEQQLGYVVNVAPNSILKVGGLVMYIESPVADPYLLEKNIHEFLNAYSTDLQEMEVISFNDIKSGVLTNLRQDPQRMGQVSARLWSDILLEEYDDDSITLLADAIEQLEYEDIVEFYQNHVLDALSSGIVSYTVGDPHQQGFEQSSADFLHEAEVIENSPEAMTNFKAEQQYYLFNPAN